jgi:hypothetical protein
MATILHSLGQSHMAERIGFFFQNIRGGVLYLYKQEVGTMLYTMRLHKGALLGYWCPKLEMAKGETNQNWRWSVISKLL